MRFEACLRMRFGRPYASSEEDKSAPPSPQIRMLLETRGAGALVVDESGNRKCGGGAASQRGPGQIGAENLPGSGRAGSRHRGSLRNLLDATPTRPTSRSSSAFRGSCGRLRRASSIACAQVTSRTPLKPHTCRRGAWGRKAADISIEGDRLVVQPVRPARYELADLVLQIREDNLHEEIPTGGPVGREAW
jgi:hypothetical protein